MSHSFSIKTKLVNSKEYLFDELRKKWILSTPEEEVRQQFWKYLHFEKKYPVSLMAIEKTIVINGLNKRFDLLIYDRNGNPNIIVECKSRNVKINESALDQILSYQYKIGAKYLVLTNGNETYCIGIDLSSKKVTYLEDIPQYINN
ncbi:MAG: type I restriction enzyme HsdR N-terminal domain-containing protein [Parvicellaceae bacterium]|tara:strand:+ start:465 stop:902 length:438 start_codon:yes stop_codon:yes gene_type:complete